MHPVTRSPHDRRPLPRPDHPVTGWLGRTRRAALATAVAGLVFALGPGHNIPFLGGTPGVGKELAIMTAVTLVSALVLVEGDAWLAGPARRGAPHEEVAA